MEKEPLKSLAGTLVRYRGGRLCFLVSRDGSLSRRSATQPQENTDRHYPGEQTDCHGNTCGKIHILQKNPSAPRRKTEVEVVVLPFHWQGPVIQPGVPSGAFELTDAKDNRIVCPHPQPDH